MFRLFIDSSTGIDVDPEWSYEDMGKKIEDRHRARDGSEYVYKWGEFDRFKVPVSYVNSEFKSVVNSWWSSNVDLKWMEEGGSVVYDVRITNSEKPINSVIRPYNDLFSGVIELESY